ncbi:hypothetical protein TNCT_218681 [Trichonephila clavata]|uniref:Uncharacterized protein n=1 Tax=Trichonephila clavata TaxID=2740835 RepID=A0A8X6JB92_TRICU|nr:hypothetical protein TNCT_218681 [Trichonephila clavata]
MYQFSLEKDRMVHHLPPYPPPQMEDIPPTSKPTQEIGKQFILRGHVSQKSRFINIGKIHILTRQKTTIGWEQEATTSSLSIPPLAGVKFTSALTTEHRYSICTRN